MIVAPASLQHGAPAALPRRLGAMLLGVTLTILAVVLIRCLCPQSPDIYWAEDPRSNVDEQGGAIPPRAMGPTVVAWLNVASVALAAAALALHVAAGGHLRWLSLGLATVGGVACAINMPRHADSLRHGADWIAAVALGIAVLHLGERENLRRWLVAALMALLVPFAIQAASYVFHEHPQTVAYFQEHEQEIARARGWPIDSVEHGLFVHRMEDWAAPGAFGLSNVFGSIVLACTCLAVGMGGSLWKRGRRRASLFAVAIVILGVFAMVLSRSRGAAVAGVLVLLLLLLVGPLCHVSAAPSAEAGDAMPRRRSFAARLWWLPLALPALILLMVLVAGLLGPARLGHGGLSLFFRYQYLKTAARMFLNQPVSMLLQGTGPGLFQDAFAHFKDPTCPEDVISTHSVFVDQVSMLGLGGAAWSAMLVLWLWNGARAAIAPRIAASEAESSTIAPSALPHRVREIRPPVLLAALVLCGVVFGVQLGVQSDLLLVPEEFLPWAIGVMAFLAILCVLAGTDRLDRPGLQLGLLLAATAVLVHGQMEMTFFQPGACAVAVLVVALCASQRSKVQVRLIDDAEQRWGGYAAAVLVLGAGAWLTTGYALPVMGQQRQLARGAESLRAGDRDGALQYLARASAILPTDPAVYRWRVRLHLEEADRLAREGQLPGVRAEVLAATQATEEAFRTGLRDLMLERLRAQVEAAAYHFLGDRAALDGAFRRWIKLTQRAPYNPRYYLELASVELDMGQIDYARGEFHKGIETGKRLALDPLMPLSDREVRQFEARLAAAIAAQHAPSPPRPQHE